MNRDKLYSLAGALVVGVAGGLVFPVGELTYAEMLKLLSTLDGQFSDERGLTALGVTVLTMVSWLMFVWKASTWVADGKTAKRIPRRHGQLFVTPWTMAGRVCYLIGLTAVPVIGIAVYAWTIRRFQPVMSGDYFVSWLLGCVTAVVWLLIVLCAPDITSWSARMWRKQRLGR